MLENYVSAMEHWQGRVDSEEDYDSFRWHQWVRPLDLNADPEPYEGPQGFAFIGFCSEQGVQRNKGRVGAALAPDLIRQQMANLPCTFKQSVEIWDAGDIICQDISMENGQAQLAEAVHRILELNLFPIVLGGGHETTFGHYCGQLSYAEQRLAGGNTEQRLAGGNTEQRLDGEEKPDIAVVNFDAHFDLRPYDRGSSSGSMFRQIADICRDRGMKYGYLPLGIQKHSNTVSLFREAERMGVSYVLARDLQYGSMASVYEKVDTFMYEHESAYITICTDVFSSAFAPGVSAPQALGLDPERVLPVIKHILRTRKIRGFDICEISPRFDQDNTTASLGAVLIFTVVNTICKLKNLAVNTGVEYYG